MNNRGFLEPFVNVPVIVDTPVGMASGVLCRVESSRHGGAGSLLVETKEGWMLVKAWTAIKASSQAADAEVGEEAANKSAEDGEEAHARPKSSLNSSGLACPREGPDGQPPTQTLRKAASGLGSASAVRSNSARCPRCGSTGPFYKDGLRYLADGTAVQRWLCRECGYRFTQRDFTQRDFNGSDGLKRLPRVHRQFLKSDFAILNNRQVCDCLTRASKNLTEVETRQEQAQREGTTQATDVKGKVLEFLWHLKKQGCTEATLENYGSVLTTFIKRGVDILNPDDVKEYLGRAPVKNITKNTFAYVYQSFLKYLGLKWEMPSFQIEEVIPFIPMEAEIDALIADSGRKLATFLQLLKETGARTGEATRLKWTDVDFERNVVRISAEKGSKPRIMPISQKLSVMLKTLPRKYERVFPTRNSLSVCFFHRRKSLAKKLANQRLLQIHFHTFRHWKGTMEYHRTKDVVHVKEILGHRDINSTMLYISIENAIFNNLSAEEYHVKAAKNLEDACKLVEVGFEYVTDIDGFKIFRKRK